ncbi:MAG: hypothetical protein LUF92_13505 [Clostridiales bacterium]|nr:hypothetical protein [Clostridiales bacterium]
MNTETPEMEKAESLALDILTLSRNTLLVNLRFLEPAFHRLAFSPDPETTLATDGFFVYYSFLHVLRTYQMKKEQVTRDYLHTVLHCIFHHPFIGDHVDSLYWNLACDIAVEAVIHELDLPHTDCPKARTQEDDLQELRSYVQPLTAERIYHYLKHCDFSVEELLTLREPFLADDHAAWYEHSEVPSQENSSSDDTETDSSEDPSSAENEEDSSEQTADFQGEPSENGNLPSAMNTEESRDNENEDGKDASGAPPSSSGGDSPSIYPDASNTERKKEWEEIADHIRNDLETFYQSHLKTARLILSNIR